MIVNLRFDQIFLYAILTRVLKLLNKRNCDILKQLYRKKKDNDFFLIYVNN